jgi:hypothetical protein
MSKQLLIYENVTPISKQRHGDYSVQMGHNYAFTKNLNALPLMAVEFPQAARDYAIIFTGKADDDTLMPAVLVGIQQENLYLSESGDWADAYIPAFVRQYPFVFASQNNADNTETTFTLCIDEAFSGCNQHGQGERLFAEGEPTPYLQSRIEFLKQYQAELQRTRLFCRHLHDLGLLEPLRANLTLPSGEKVALAGFMGISRDKVKALSGDQLAQLAASDELELIYVQLQSMRNFDEMRERYSR